MADKQFPLALVIKAVDKATGPLRKINDELDKATGPLKDARKEFSRFGELSGLKNVGSALGNVGSSLKKVGSEAFSLIAKFAAIGAGAAFGFFQIVKGAVESGDKLNEMSKRVGMGVDAYARLQFAADQSDVSQEEFNNSLDQFNLRLGQLKQNTGPLKSLPPIFRNQLKGAKDTRSAFDLAIRAMAKMGSASEKAALARELFGKSGLQFSQFLAQGEVGIKKLEEEFTRLAGSKKKFANGADDLDNAMKKTGVAFEGLRDAALAELFPALTQLTNAVTDFLAQNRDGLRKWAEEAATAIQNWIKGGGIERTVQGFKDIAASISKIVDALGGPSGLIKAFVAFQSMPLIGSILGLGVSFAQLGIALALVPSAAWAALAPLGAFALAAAGLAGAGLLIYKNWEPLKLFFSELFSQPWDTLKDLGAWFVTDFNAPASRALPPGASRQTNDARVTIDVNGLPPGSRATIDRASTAEVDLSTGPALVLP